MEDHEIIKLYFLRDEVAINETSSKYHNYCYKIAFNILSNREDSEECVNDTFLGAWKAIPPHKPDKLSSFLGKITRNIALDRFDYNHAGKRSFSFNGILDELKEVIPSSENVEAYLEERELSNLINLFLGKMDVESRKIFVRRYWFGDSIVDISKFYQITESKVKSNLFRTRNKLRLHLEKEGYII